MESLPLTRRFSQQSNEMESVQPSERLSKLPPSSPASFTTVQRKSFVRVTSSEDLSKPPQMDNIASRRTGVSNGASADRIPYFRSVSSNGDLCFSLLNRHPVYESLLSRIPALSSHDHQVSRPQSSISKRTLIDRCSSSGYESNNGSSFSSGILNSALSSSPGIRRTSSVNYLHRQSVLNDLDSSRSDHSNSHLYNEAKSKRYSLNEKSIKEEVVHGLDRIEKRISFLKEIAFELLEEKEKLVNALTQITDTCSLNTFNRVDLLDIQATIRGLLQRLSSVEILIKSTRSTRQTEALQKANQSIEQLKVVLAKMGKMAAKQRCLSYISSCSSDNLPDTGHSFNGIVPIDDTFQKVVIECALEDQKIIKKKLENFLHAIDNA